MEDRSPQGLRSSYAGRIQQRSTALSRQRTRAAYVDEELPALLANDRVFALAQVTLFVKLMLTVFVLDYQALDTFALPKSVAAHATSLVLAALLFWLFARYGRRLLSWSPVHVAVRALLVAFSLATVLALASGFVAIVLLALVVSWRRAWWRRGILALGLLLAVAILASPTAARLLPATLLKDPSIAVRAQIWDTAERAVAARPLLGLGPDNFVVFYPANRSEASAKTGLLENSTHSNWLYVATSAGLVGLAALFALIALVIEQGIRAAQRGQVGAVALVPLFAYLGQSFVGINEIVLDSVFWLSAGVLVAASATAVQRPRTGHRRPRSAALTGVVAIDAAAAVAVTLVFPRIATDESISISELYNNADRRREAIPV